MSEDQFTKLFEYMQKLEAQMGSNQAEVHDLVAKLYEHMEQRFDKLQAELAAKAERDRLEQVYNLVDQVLKNQETDKQERQVMSHQLDRHVDWIKQLADKTDTKLVPEP